MANVITLPVDALQAMHRLLDDFPSRMTTTPTAGTLEPVIAVVTMAA